MATKDREQNLPDPQEVNPGHLVTPTGPDAGTEDHVPNADDSGRSIVTDDVTGPRQDDDLNNPRTGPIR